MEGVAGVQLPRGLECRWFEDFFLGERFTLPTRTLNETAFRSFADASGEAHPLHNDLAYCREQGHPAMLAHGFLVAIQTTAGSGLLPFMIEQSVVTLLDQSSRFVRPVYAGDTLHPVLQVSELAPNKTTGVLALRSMVHNQRQELVLEGSQRWLLRVRPT